MTSKALSTSVAGLTDEKSGARSKNIRGGRIPVVLIKCDKCCAFLGLRCRGFLAEDLPWVYGRMGCTRHLA